ncbi:MAG: hypothetical protein WDN27_04850 [Candidatus Saccharibacteria bacterium]
MGGQASATSVKTSNADTMTDQDIQGRYKAAYQEAACAGLRGRGLGTCAVAPLIGSSNRHLGITEWETFSGSGFNRRATSVNAVQGHAIRAYAYLAVRRRLGLRFPDELARYRHTKTQHYRYYDQLQPPFL